MKVKIGHQKSELLEKEETVPSNDNIRKSFNEKVRGEKYHFLKTLKMDEVFQDIYSMKEFTKDFEVMLHIGIGGSGLAPLVLRDMFFHKITKKLLVTENLDENYLASIFETIEPSNTCIHVVSKSGNTAETIANFFAVYRWMRKKLSEDETLKRTVITTNPETGYLNEIAKKKKVKRLIIPGELTGRFSAISPVGLFPALFLELDISRILQGARNMLEEMKSDDTHPVLIMAEHIFHLYESGKNIFVFMPYSEKLQTLSRWFVQLWAESLGKNGKGQTPVPAKGVTDQHTILQLIMDGPPDKMVVTVRIENEPSIFLIKELDGIAPPSYLKGASITELKEAEYFGTVRSMKNKGVPVIEIYLNELSEETAGKLFILFEVLVSLMGEAMGINPFDQPAVEEGKRLARSFLEERKGG